MNVMPLVKKMIETWAVNKFGEDAVLKAKQIAGEVPQSKAGAIQLLKKYNISSNQLQNTANTYLQKLYNNPIASQFTGTINMAQNMINDLSKSIEYTPSNNILDRVKSL